MNALSSTTVLARLATQFDLQLASDPDALGWRHIANAAGRALCGHDRTEPVGPLTLWGVETHASERWCSLCAAEAAELLARLR